MIPRILVVDDSPVMRKVVRRAAIQAGAQDGSIMEAGNGREALDLVDKNWFDVVLLDLNMPIMDGLHFVREVRAREATKDLGIVVVTTESNRQRMAELTELGISGYLHKPFEPETLRELIAKILEGLP